MYRMSWSVSASRLVLGVLALGFGTAMALDRLAIIQVGPVQSLWPFAVLATGLLFFAETPGRGIPVTGVWLVALGVWLVVNQLVGAMIGHYVGALGDIVKGSWPVLFVIAGAGMVLHTLIGLAAPRRTAPRFSNNSVTSRLEPIGFLSRVARDGRHGR